MAEKRMFEFQSTEAAFEGLCTEVKEHSIRTGEYAEIIFIEACARELYLEHYKTSNKLNVSYAAVMKQAGTYHEIGKALVPEVYQKENPQFTKEETALYRKHTVDGKLLLEELLAGQEEYNKIEQAFLIEAAGGHHESWDGFGYPEGTAGLELHVSARITAIADKLDHLVMKKVSEKPFEEAVTELKELAGTILDPEFVSAAVSAKARLKKVFLKYEKQSRAIPVTEQLVKRRASRPVEQLYRPIMKRNPNKIIGYECQVEFGGGKKLNIEPLEIKKELQKKKLLYELDRYRIYETLDTVRRFDTCGIRCFYIAIALTPATYTRKDFIETLEQMREEEEAESRRLRFCIPQEQLQRKTKVLREAIRELKNRGYQVMGTDITREGMPLADLREMEVNGIRLAADQMEELNKPEYRRYIHELQKAGIEVMADGWEKVRHSTVLNELGIELAAGMMAGDYRQEDEIVGEELAQRA